MYMKLKFTQCHADFIMWCFHDDRLYILGDVPGAGVGIWCRALCHATVDWRGWTRRVTGTDRAVSVTTETNHPGRCRGLGRRRCTVRHQVRLIVSPSCVNVWNSNRICHHCVMKTEKSQLDRKDILVGGNFSQFYYTKFFGTRHFFLSRSQNWMRERFLWWHSI